MPYLARVHATPDGGLTITPIQCATTDENDRLKARVADLERQLALIPGEPMQARLRGAFGLTKSEAAILSALHAKAPNTATKDQLFFALYGDRHDGGPDLGTSIVKQFVANVRGKIGKEMIANVWGEGFRLTPAGQEACRAALDRLRHRT